MKYIRTKDSIYKATEINGMIVARGGVAYSCDIADVHFPIVFKEQDIVKQADTIEELCDEYVVNCSKDYEYPEYYPKVCEYWLLDDYSQADGFTVYGAIWTDKGLIYVAKMNEKGELELL